ncbi:Zinc finger protein 2 [Folsomia candida]|uniref:Zinc finger protein 2 n=1 Tax=Folsomia candida TaxID=158441 RepID=A0A226CTF4_FOLCA|nr:Zinc finger protein 2 [Folsomia candida]
MWANYIRLQPKLNQRVSYLGLFIGTRESLPGDFTNVQIWTKIQVFSTLDELELKLKQGLFLGTEITHKIRHLPAPSVEWKQRVSTYGGHAIVRLRKCGTLPANLNPNYMNPWVFSTLDKLELMLIQGWFGGTEITNKRNPSSAPNSIRTRFTCEKCPRTFLSKDGFFAHWKDYHSTIKKYSCHLCPFKTRHRTGIPKHLKGTHSQGSKFFECYFCKRKLTTKAGLELHIAAHTMEQEPASCSYAGCGKTFTRKGNLHRHVKMDHSENPELFGCTLCGKEFKSRKILYTHIAVHTKERSNKCDTCGKSFIDLTVLKRHLWTHQGKSSNQPIFQCQECPRTYLDKSSLMSHVNSYHGSASAKYCCQFCTYTTYQKSHLNRHLRRKNNCQVE